MNIPQVPETTERKILTLPLERIEQIENARVTFNEQDLSELMTSIKHRGLLSPIGVRALGPERWEVVFGNRRLVAARKLGWKNIDAILVSAQTDEEMLIVNAVENMQRVDVPFAEQGRIFEGLVKSGLNAKEIAVRVGIPVKRVQRIIEAYQHVPSDLRPKVSTGGRGVPLDGKISLSTVTASHNLQARVGLDSAETAKVMRYAAERNISNEKVRRLGNLVKGGISLDEALKKIDSTRILTLSIPIDASHAARLEELHGMRIMELIYRFLASQKWLRMTTPRNYADEDTPDFSLFNEDGELSDTKPPRPSRAGRKKK